MLRKALAPILIALPLVLQALAPGGTPRATAAEPAPVENVRIDLSVADGEVIHSYRPSRDAQAVVIVLASDRDVDLFVYGSQRELEADSPTHIGNSWHNIECARIELDPRARARPLLIQAVDPEGPAEGASALLAIAEERGGRRFVLPGEPEIVTIEAGSAEGIRDLLLIDDLEFAAVRGECAAGVSGLTVRMGEASIEGRNVGKASEALVDERGGLAAGIWEVTVSRPPGVDADEEVTIAIEASLATAVPSPERQAAGAPMPLPGRGGSVLVEIDEETSALHFIDLERGAGSIAIATDAEEGDFDIYVSRGAPALGGDDWGWASWHLGPDEDLVVGGEGRLPAGRYWLMIDHHSGEDPAMTLSWEVREGTSPLATQGPLANGADSPIDFGPDQCIAWWSLSEECRRGAHLQVLYSDKRVEIAVARRDTGEVLSRTDLSRKSPNHRFDAMDLAPGGAELIVGVLRWTMDEPVSAGRLFLGSTARPLPPADYFPPYPAFTDGPRDRMLASTVEISGEDGGGTAVVVSPSGLLLTCEHVVEGETEMIVYAPTGERGRPREVFTAEPLHADPELDLALLRITGDVFGREIPKDRPLPFAPMGDSAPMRLADPIFLPGYPTSASSAFGSNLVLSVGVLSGVEVERDGARWLISDGRYADGNSGSGLFDAGGVLRGVHSMTVGPDGGSLGYARPLDRLPAAWRETILAEGGRWTTGR